MITNDAVQTFLTGHRIAVAGASDDQSSFGRAIVAALADHGYDPVPIHPRASEVEGRPAYPRLQDVPEPLDGVIVMVSGEAAATVVDDAAAAGLDQVWLFRGIGGKGAVSQASLEACARHGIVPIAGACPLMFLEPVTGAHRFHRSIRQLRGAVERAAS
jgi:predicted CoA-binding protein